MKRKHSKTLSATELMDQLNTDPEFLRQSRERDRDAKRLEERLHTEQLPLLNDLATVGLKVQSVWDLVNAKYDYEKAVPTLLRHIVQPYHPKIREGIARALTIDGLDASVGLILIREIKASSREDEHEFRWALANALSCVADPSIAAQIEALRTNNRLASLRAILNTALERVRERGKER